MKKIPLKIAQTYFNINSENEFCVGKEIEKYICNEEKENVVNFKISIVDEFYALRCKFVMNVDERMSVFKSEDDLYEYRIFFNLITKEPCALYKEVGENSAEIVLLKRYFEKIEINSDLLSYFAMEKYLLKDGAIVLHSSFIKHNNEAILFTAPSGTGKSTQADLWEKYSDAEIINGDRSILMVEGDEIYAYGLPFCGTSGIEKNTCAKVKAIIYLQQSPTNCANKLYEKDIIKKIFSETTKNLWNEEYIDMAGNIIENLAQEVVMYEYSCTKYEDAVLYLKDKLEVV